MATQEEKNKSLYEAAKAGDISAIDKALKEGAQIDGKVEIAGGKYTATHAAAWYENAGALSFLIQKGADTSIKTEKKAGTGDPETLQQLGTAVDTKAVIAGKVIYSPLAAEVDAMLKLGGYDSGAINDVVGLKGLQSFAKSEGFELSSLTQESVEKIHRVLVEKLTSDDPAQDEFKGNVRDNLVSAFEGGGDLNTKKAAQVVLNVLGEGSDMGCDKLEIDGDLGTASRQVYDASKGLIDQLDPITLDAQRISKVYEEQIDGLEVDLSSAERGAAAWESEAKWEHTYHKKVEAELEGKISDAELAQEFDALMDEEKCNFARDYMVRKAAELDVSGGQKSGLDDVKARFNIVSGALLEDVKKVEHLRDLARDDNAYTDRKDIGPDGIRPAVGDVLVLGLGSGRRNEVLTINEVVKRADGLILEYKATAPNGEDRTINAAAFDSKSHMKAWGINGVIDTPQLLKAESAKLGINTDIENAAKAEIGHDIQEATISAFTGM